VKPEQNRQEPWGQGHPVKPAELLTSGQLRIAVLLQPRRAGGYRDIVPGFEEEKPGEGTPSNPPEAVLVQLLKEHHFPEGHCRKRVVTSLGIATFPDWLHEPTKVAVYLDGMSRGLHGDPNMAKKDHIIRGAIELDGYTVIVVQSRDLNDPQAVRQHLRNIAQAMGRGDLV